MSGETLSLESGQKWCRQMRELLHLQVIEVIDEKIAVLERRRQWRELQQENEDDDPGIRAALDRLWQSYERLDSEHEYQNALRMDLERIEEITDVEQLTREIQRIQTRLEKGFRVPRSPKPGTPLDRLGDVQLSHEQVKLQAPNMCRNTEQSRSVALRLVGSRGELREVGQIRESVQNDKHVNTPQSQHLLKMLDQLEENPKLTQTLERLQAPQGDQPVAGLLRATLGLPKDTELTDGQTRQAVTSSLLTQLRQSSAASCGPTSLAIRVQSQNPEQFLEDLENLLTQGCLERTIDKGNNLAIPSKDFDQALKRALRTVDVGKKQEQELEKAIRQLLQSKTDVSLKEIESAVRQSAGSMRIELGESWTPLSKIRVPLNTCLPPDDLECPLSLEVHTAASIRQQPGIKAVLETLGYNDPQVQEEQLNSALQSIQEDKLAAYLTAVGEMDCHTFLKVHLLEVLPKQINEQTDEKAFEQLLRKEVDRFLLIGGAKEEYLKDFSDRNNLSKVAQRATALSVQIESVTPQQLISKLAGGNPDNVESATRAFQSQQENLLLRAWEFTVANMAMEYDGGEQLKDGLREDFGEVMKHLTKELGNEAPSKEMVELLKDEFYRVTKSLKVTYDPTKSAGHCGDGQSNRGGMVLVDPSQPDVPLDTPDKIVPLLVERLRSSKQEDESGAWKKTLDSLDKKLREKWPSVMALYNPTTVWPDELLPVYEGKQCIEVSNVKPKDSVELFKWLTSEGKKKGSEENDSCSVWNDVHAFSFRPKAMENIEVDTFRGDEQARNQKRMDSQFAAKADPCDAMVQRIIHKALGGALPIEAEQEVQRYLREEWDSPLVSAAQLKEIIDWYLYSVWKVDRRAQEFYDGAMSAGILEIMPPMLAGACGPLVEDALRKLRIPKLEVARVKEHCLVALGSGEVSMAKLQQQLDKSLEECALKDDSHTSESIYRALQQPAGVVFADSNWGGDGDERGNQQTVFAMVMNPQTNVLEMWQMNEDGSDPSMLDDSWITGTSGWSMPN